MVLQCNAGEEVAAFFTLGLQSQTTLETFFVSIGGYGILTGGAMVPAAPTKQSRFSLALLRVKHP